MSDQFLGVNPILPANNVADTAQFFEKELGFNIECVWSNPSYGVVKRGQTVIEFGEGRKEHAGSGVCFIHVKDADQVHDELRLKNIEFVGDLADRDYGSRDFRVKDNNGNVLIIGHALKNQRQLLQEGSVA